MADEIQTREDVTAIPGAALNSLTQTRTRKPDEINPEAVNKIKIKLWENIGIIDEYLDSEEEIKNEDFQIIRAWKNSLAALQGKNYL